MPAKIHALSLYDQYFSPSNPNDQLKDWEAFKSKEKDFDIPLAKRDVDFSVQDKTWLDTAREAASLIVTIALFSYVFRSKLQRVTPSFFSNRIDALFRKSKLVEIASKYASDFYSKNFIQKAKPIETLAVKFLPKLWVYHKIARYVAQRLIMIPLYPAQSRIVKLVAPIIKTSALNEIRRESAPYCNKEQLIYRDVVLEKNGVRYSGLLIGHQDTIRNGQWVLQATGNMEPIEHSVGVFTNTYKKYGFNTLMINGPAVGKSQGQATPDSMGDAQEVGMTFIETALKAKKIVIAGRSLGGAAIGQGILKHTFKTDIKYLAVFQMTFDRASNICGKMVGQLSSSLEGIVAKIVRWAVLEMDTVAASQKLQDLGIQSVIAQASNKVIPEGQLPTVDDFQTDGPILAHASLGYALIHEGITKHKVFLCLKDAGHMTHDAVTAAEKEIRAL